MTYTKNKYLFLIIPAIIFSQTVNAKSFFIEDPKKKEKKFESGFFVHYTAASNIKNKQWTNFVNTYNAAINPLVPLTNFKTHYSFDVGYTAQFKSFFATFSWQHLNLKSEAGFNYNEIRRFQYYNNALTLGVGGKILHFYKEKIILFLTADIRFGGASRITSSYVYRDGFESFGGDREINGTYLDAGTLGSEWGALLKFKLFKGFALETKFVYQFNNSVLPSSFTDLSEFKTFNNAGIGVLNIPADYLAYLNQGGSNYILSNGADVKSNFKGYKLCFGISYSF